MFMWIDFPKIKNYIIDSCELTGISNAIFEDSAIKALSSNCNGSTRQLNNFIDKCLLIYSQKKKI